MIIRRKWCLLFVTFWLLMLPKHAALAQTTLAGSKSIFEIWMPAVAALVGGLISGILGPLLKDVVIQRWNERRADKKLQDQIERSYFAPISASAEKVIWRMSEIILEKRAHFLLLKTCPRNFSQYKRISTLYRIAALLGWIRAISLELSALPRGGFGATSPVFKALAKVQSALADGHGVEKRRVRSFCTGCGIDVSTLTESQFASLAASFEVAMYALATDELRKNHHHLVDSTTLQQEFVCRGLLKLLEDHGLNHSLEDQKFLSSIPSLIGFLGYREALIYREWQDAIGDAMIVKDELSTARRYRIIGFEEFERLIASGTFNWIEPFREFIEDVDFETPDLTDERPKHLRDLAEGVAAVLVAISDSSQGELVNPEALKRARQILGSRHSDKNSMSVT